VPFFMVDDQLHVNKKAQSLIDLGQSGVAAIGLWTLVGSQVQAQTADGQVLASAWRLLGDKRLFAKLSRLLVDVGLWEDRDSGDEGWQYHDWFDIGYAPGEKVKLNRKRTKEMKNPDIVEAVKARDGDRCRYCARKVDWNDKRGDKGATYDHVIPGLARGVTNLVVACRKCNRDKAQRTPEQAGMTLLPPPNGPDAETKSWTKSGPSPDQVEGPSPDQVADQKGATPLRTRSRSRSGSGPGEGDGQVADQVPGEAGPAGEAPPVPPSPGHTGSPFHNWHGPPPPVDEAKCPTHQLDMPCRRCTADHYREEADPS
jgi:hypothetical protein